MFFGKQYTEINKSIDRIAEQGNSVYFTVKCLEQIKKKTGSNERKN